MPSSPFKKVTVVGGSGRLGPFILQALLEEGFDVTAVTRNSSTATFPDKVKVIRVPDDYPEEEMTKTFQGADAVVLSLGFGGIPHHSKLVDATQKAGVKRLIASTFGGHDGNKAVDDFFPISQKQHAMLVDMKAKEKEGWTWTSINVGLFFDFCVANGFFGFDSKEGKATMWDDGNYQFSATTRATIGKGVTGVLNHPEETVNKSVYISSFEVSLNEIFDAVKKSTGDTRDWSFTKVDTMEQLRLGKEEWAQGKMMGMAKLALGSHLRASFDANFPKDVGRLDNDLLGIKRENVDQVVHEALKEAPK